MTRKSRYAVASFRCTSIVPPALSAFLTCLRQFWLNPLNNSSVSRVRSSRVVSNGRYLTAERLSPKDLGAPSDRSYRVLQISEHCTAHAGSPAAPPTDQPRPLVSDAEFVKLVRNSSATARPRLSLCAA